MIKVWCGTFDVAIEESNEIADFEYRAIVNVYSIAENDEDFVYKAATALYMDKFKDIEITEEPSEAVIDSSLQSRHQECIKQAIDSKRVVYGVFYSYPKEGND